LKISTKYFVTTTGSSEFGLRSVHCLQRIS